MSWPEERDALYDRANICTVPMSLEIMRSDLRGVIMHINGRIKMLADKKREKTAKHNRAVKADVGEIMASYEYPNEPRGSGLNEEK